MSRIKCLVSAICVALTVAIWAGCSPPAGPEKAKDAATAEGEKTPAATAPNADAQAGTPEGLAELSPEDRAAAEKQRVCPVTGEVLGSMGKPYKISVKGQTVFLCCSGCEEEIRNDPDKFLAKIKENEKK
jgi:YHS domain-containing protein